ncbi:MAG: Asp-tRNA(Asn)/Glu-tRNA(Gln) amidotransferase subunit GatB, partial [Actinobacteria bacterium]|nr:Asp-tRNA(Asn)/Glu-tRNA(Gln) amidotransferase subunit GatB [Actinomycetota bacterium]
VDLTILTGLALNCSIPEYAKFDRKNYSYPDLMKWYQISQYDLPLCVRGWLDVDGPSGRRRIGIKRVHLEEDTAKLTHVTGDDGVPASLIDVNRSGVPLMEIVSEPELTSPEEAVAYGVKLRNLLRWLGVSTTDMQHGALRVDANISVWRHDEPVANVKVEIKNMNSFRALGRALAHEAQRQAAVRAAGQPLVQETRGWDEASGTTLPQRTKEHAHDYRYFPEPDLPPLQISRARVERLRAELPALPEAVARDLVATQGVAAEAAAELTSDRALARYALEVIARHPYGADVVTWILQDVRRVLNARQLTTETIPVPPAEMAALLALRRSGGLSSSMAAQVLDEMFATGRSVEAIIAARGRQISDADALAALVQRVIAEHPQAAEDFRAGKKPAIQFLVGQIMKATRGQANPPMVTELLRRELGG